MARRKRTTHVVVHTAADSRKDASGAHVDTSPETITDWHTWRKPSGRGWPHIGYHAVVRKSGEVVETLPLDQKGIHCRDKSMNHKAVGVCFSGHGGDDYWDIPGEKWTPEQEKAGIKYLASLCERYGLSPSRVIGHRETGARKACPGDRIDMDRVRRLVAEAMEGALPEAPAKRAPKRPLIQRGDEGKHVEAAQRVLKRLGLYTGRIDGDFGPRTDRAVREYQRLQSLGVDGKVGRNTWAALRTDGLDA